MSKAWNLLCWDKTGATIIFQFRVKQLKKNYRNVMKYKKVVIQISFEFEIRNKRIFCQNWGNE